MEKISLAVNNYIWIRKFLYMIFGERITCYLVPREMLQFTSWIHSLVTTGLTLDILFDALTPVLSCHQCLATPIPSTVCWLFCYNPMSVIKLSLCCLNTALRSCMMLIMWLLKSWKISPLESVLLLLCWSFVFCKVYKL